MNFRAIPQWRRTCVLKDLPLCSERLSNLRGKIQCTFCTHNVMGWIGDMRRKRLSAHKKNNCQNCNTARCFTGVVPCYFLLHTQDRRGSKRKPCNAILRSFRLTEAQQVQVQHAMCNKRSHTPMDRDETVNSLITRSHGTATQFWGTQFSTTSFTFLPDEAGFWLYACFIGGWVVV